MSNFIKTGRTNRASVLPRIVVCLMAFFISSPAVAADWWPIGLGDSGTAVVWMDRESKRANSEGAIEAWSRTTAMKGTKAKSKTLWQYDCHNRTITLMSSINYRPDGSIRTSVDIPDFAQESQHIVPDSRGEMLWKFVCEGS